MSSEYETTVRMRFLRPTSPAKCIFPNGLLISCKPPYLTRPINMAAATGMGVFTAGVDRHELKLPLGRGTYGLHLAGRAGG
jgi:hypothetical protein